MANSPAECVRQLLVDLGLGTDAGTWPVYATTEPDVPDNCITCYDTVGQDHGRTMPDSVRQGLDGVQVRIRSSGHAAGRSKANDVALALDAVYQKVVHVGSANYHVHAVNRSLPIETRGKDAPNSKRSLFFLNCLLHVEPA
jgi:hypothetical protein